MAAPLGCEFHLDLVGGLAGDMFVAALVDLRPELKPGIDRALQHCGRLLDGVSCRFEKHNDGRLAGSRFIVSREGDQPSQRKRADPAHSHVDWRALREGLDESLLEPAVKRHALGIFSLLAEAEARVHGCAAEAVTFHEVGAWDSIADIVAAARVIESSRASKWTVSAVPLGSGRVQTAHGALPVPAPATALLLEGFVTVDDGVAGERVTPTGAAILRYLARDDGRRGARRLVGSGFGFGSRRLTGLSNCVRVLEFEAIAEARPGADEVAVIEFEVDDQSPEDLALALDRIRAARGVYDVVQIPTFGKKSRMGISVRLLMDPSVVEDLASMCFVETTTLGLRYRFERRRILPREIETVRVGEREVRVKVARRPNGFSAKAEADDLADAPDRLARQTIRDAAERRTVEDEK